MFKNRTNILKKGGRTIIGVIHFPPLLGYPTFPGLAVAEKNALKDLKTLEAGGVDAIMIENNYDQPHAITVGPASVASMSYLAGKIRGQTQLPLGISVLWNDYQAALSLAKVYGYQFVRVPVFVDTVRTSCGVIKGTPADVIKFRSSIGATNVAILTDIHVKHAKLLSKASLIQSAHAAVKYGADGVIVTGKWTGDAPEIDHLEDVYNVLGKKPLFVGSGADEKNVSSLLLYASGIIVSTSLKKGAINKEEINVKGYGQRIDLQRVKKLVQAKAQKLA